MVIVIVSNTDLQKCARSFPLVPHVHHRPVLELSVLNFTEEIIPPPVPIMQTMATKLKHRNVEASSFQKSDTKKQPTACKRPPRRRITDNFAIT